MYLYGFVLFFLTFYSVENKYTQSREVVGEYISQCVTFIRKKKKLFDVPDSVHRSKSPSRAGISVTFGLKLNFQVEFSRIENTSEKKTFTRIAVIFHRKSVSSCQSQFDSGNWSVKLSISSNLTTCCYRNPIRKTRSPATVEKNLISSSKERNSSTYGLCPTRVNADTQCIAQIQWEYMHDFLWLLLPPSQSIESLSVFVLKINFISFSMHRT